MTTRPFGHLTSFTFSGTTEQVQNVNRRRTLVAVTNAGSTFDVVGYMMTADQATRRGLTRTKHKIVTGSTAANLVQEVPPGFQEVGVEVTSYVGAVVADVSTINVDA